MNLYQQEILDHARHPHHGVKPATFNHELRLENPNCGDYVSVYLLLDGEVIKDVAFEVDGCAISVAAASMLSDQLMGKDKAFLEGLDAKYMLDLLGIPLTATRIKCATLGLDAAKLATKTTE